MYSTFTVFLLVCHVLRPGIVGIVIDTNKINIQFVRLGVHGGRCFSFDLLDLKVGIGIAGCCCREY